MSDGTAIDPVEVAVRQALAAVGEDPDREGLLDTPRRYAKALREFTAGMHKDPREPLARTFEEKYDEIVCVSGIEFVSMCEHHLLPFSGTAWFAYIPDGRVVGLSKIPRFIAVLANRLQVQERLTVQVADVFEEVLHPRAVAVVMRAQHSCMRCRGARSTGEMVTSVMRGRFKESDAARAEVLHLMGLR